MTINSGSREELRRVLKEKYPDNPEKWAERFCSFCGIGSDTAKGMATGPNNVAICNECAFLANESLKHYNNR